MDRGRRKGGISTKNKTRIMNVDVILVLVASFCYMCCTMMITPIITGYTESFGGSGLIMGLIGGLMTTVSLFCRPIAGNLTDRIDKFRISFFGSLLLFLACVGYCVTPSISGLAAARIVNGVGFTCCSVGMSTWLSMLLPKDKLGAGIGYYGTVQAIGMAIAPSIGIRIKSAVGYRGSFVAAALFALVALLATLLVTDRARPAPRARPRRFRPQVIEWHIAPIALCVMLFTVPYSATQSFLVSYVETKGCHVQADLFFPTYAAILTALRIGLRNQFDKVPFLRFLAINIVSSFAALFSLTVMDNYLHMFLAAIFMAGGYGLLCSVAQSTAMLLVGNEKRGLANGTYYVGLDLGLAFGPILGGLLYEHMAIALFYPVLSICSVLCIAVYFLCRHTYRTAA